MIRASTDPGALARIDAALELRYRSPGLLASRWFWGGGLCSLLVWSAIVYATWRYFA